MTLEVRPHVFDGVELWSVRRESLCEDLALGCRKEVAYQLAAMNGRSVPDDEDAPFEVAPQVLDELYDLRAFDAALVHLKVKPLKGDSADDGEALPVKALMEQRGLPTQRPGSHACGLGAQSALVHEDDDATLAVGVFFSVGHVLRFQVPMAFSSRSRARRSGLWQEKPSAPSTRQTWPAW